MEQFLVAFNDQFFLDGLFHSLYKVFLFNGLIISFLKNLVNVAFREKPKESGFINLLKGL